MASFKKTEKHSNQFSLQLYHKEHTYSLIKQSQIQTSYIRGITMVDWCVGVKRRQRRASTHHVRSHNKCNKMCFLVFGSNEQQQKNQLNYNGQSSFLSSGVRTKHKIISYMNIYPKFQVGIKFILCPHFAPNSGRFFIHS